MKKNTVKKIFIFFMIFLPLQYAAVGIVGVMASEPWPAFVFPGFKSVYATSDIVSVSKPVFIAQTNAGKHEVDTQLLFEGMKESQRLGFLKSNFSDSVKLSNLSYSSRQWLKKRIEKYYPSLGPPRVLQIQWEQYIYSNLADKPVLESTKVEKTLSITL